ncbi:MAG: hypothetical protein IPM29_06600 [Planctomycetes bacterium]|nr:hypothetical protein [Planctomycetota bacterium]
MSPARFPFPSFGPRPRFLAALVAACLFGRVLPQERIYPLDEGCGGVTYAYGSNFGASLIQTNRTDTWTPGRFGTALRGFDRGTPSTDYRYFSTIWGRAQDYTAALFLQERYAPTQGIAVRLRIAECNPQSQTKLHVLNATGELEIALLKASGGAHYIVVPGFQALARGRWLHVAVVHEAAPSQVTVYFDGGVVHTEIVPPLSNGQLTCFGSGPSRPCIYDLDEITYVPRAMTAAEVATLSQHPRAGTAVIPGGCGSPVPTLTAAGLPQPGSSAFSLDVVGFRPHVAAAVTFGSDICSWNGMPLPVTTLGCVVAANLDLAAVTVLTDGAGTLRLPVPLPTGLAPGTIYAQAFSIDPPAGALLGTNAVGIAIGQ